MSKYLDGLEILVGDRVTYGGHAATIVFVLDTEQFSSAFPRADWIQLKGKEHPLGILWDKGGEVICDSPDEDLVFVARNQP